MILELRCGEQTLLFVNVYMPYCSDDNHLDFMFYLGKINSVLSDSNTPYVFIHGVFNANICTTETERRHKFGMELKKFCINESLFLSDVLFCSDNSYTYYSEAHQSVSWLDHIICTVPIVLLIIYRLITVWFHQIIILF